MNGLKFIQEVTRWAEVRGFHESDPKVQYLSCVEESVKEISEAKITLNEKKLIDSIGDTAVTLVILNMQIVRQQDPEIVNRNDLVTGDYIELMFRIGDISGYLRRERWKEALSSITIAWDCLELFAKKSGLEFEKCCETAWNEIKDRKGLMVNGSYVKYEDFTDDQRIEFMNREESSFQKALKDAPHRPKIAEEPEEYNPED